MNDLNAMLVFAQVVEQGSFVGAARRLALPKTTVTRRIQQLEAALQVQLLQRSTRVVKPTEAGQLYYEYCHRIAAEVEEAEAAVQSQKSEPTGTLKLCAPSAFTHFFLKSLFPKFLTRYPKIRLVHESQNRAVNPLREGFDLVIRIGPVEDSALKIQLFGEATVQLFASPLYLEKAGIPLHVHDLARHDTVATGKAQSHQYSWKLVGPTGEQEIVHTPRCIVNDPTVCYDLVMAGMGIGLLPSFYGDEGVRDGKLVPVLTQWCSNPVMLSAIYPVTKARSPKVKVFLQFLDEALKLYGF
jgi:LysR family transcriptional regulator, regulator for bpeEF and oprC